MTTSMFPEDERYLSILIDRIGVDGVLLLLINVLEQRYEVRGRRKQLEDRDIELFKTAIDTLDGAVFKIKRAYNKHRKE